MRCYSIKSKTNESHRFIYETKCPPNSSVSETWRTVGLENDGAQLTFVEYDFYDKDPDGVREAYDCMYESEYEITVNSEMADSEKLFAYTVTNDNTVSYGFNIDMKNARTIFVVTEPLSVDDNTILSVTEKINVLMKTEASQEPVNDIVTRELLCQRDGTSCFILYNSRM